MNYLSNEIVILQEAKKNENLTEKEKLALSVMLEGYNKVYALAAQQQKYIKDKRPEYAKQVDQNCRLLERNGYLEKEIDRLKKAYKQQAQYVRDVEKENRSLEKLLKDINKKTKEE